MSILDNIKNIFTRSSAPMQTTDGAQGISMTYPFLSSFSRSTAMSLPAVYRCVQIISDAIASMPIQTYRVDEAGNKSLAVDNTVYQLLRLQPSPSMTKFDMLKLAVSSMLLKGNGYIQIVRSKNGQPIELIFRRADEVVIAKSAKNRLQKYIVTGWGNVSPTDMIHLMMYSNDGINGESVISMQSRSVNIANSAEDASFSFYDSGCNLTGLISMPNIADRRQKQQILDDWGNTFLSNGTRSSLNILPAGAQYQQIGVNAKDAQLLEARNYNTLQICQMFGVPASFLEIQGSVSYNSLEMDTMRFLVFTLQPILQRIEEQFESKLFLPSERAHYDVQFDTTNLLRTDATTQAQYFSTLINAGVMTVNEARTRMNLPAVEGGDVLNKPLNIEQIDAVKNNDDENE